MTATLDDITQRENTLIRSFRGVPCIPEANDDLNDLQREKINAIYEVNGKAYIGKVNFYGAERERLTPDSVFVDYTGQMVHNFEADFVVPAIDNTLAEMIVQWNTGGLPTSLMLIERITGRVDKLSGVNLIWS